ncbi:hypothetical protein GMORB2_2908, partial [Geosmithia morbida]
MWSPGSTVQGTPPTPLYESHDNSGDKFDDQTFHGSYAGQPPTYCHSTGEIHASRTSFLPLFIYVLSLYTTIMSGIWLVVSILQPRWGYGISSRRGLDPSTATTLAALISKTIEMSFVTVFITFLGQVLTRRSILGNRYGMTLGEMSMRNWVIQPGSLLTHAETIPGASMTILGALSLMAMLGATFYTTASDSMISPKLKYGKWATRELYGYVRASYANAQYVESSCPQLIGREDPIQAPASCMNIQSSGDSYHNLLSIMTTWTDMDRNGTTSRDSLGTLLDRPAGTALLYDNVTMLGTWIETEHSNVALAYLEHKRVINNVTMAMPHPGVYKAVRAEINNIMQPDDLAGVGSYSVRAGVVSPTINALCVNMDAEELAPLIYTTWPDSTNEATGVGNQVVGHSAWQDEVPQAYDADGKADYLNETVLDSIFEWGERYGRRPPVFQLYPSDYNLVTNSTIYMGDAIYLLGKSPSMDDYTLCQLRSWVSPNCSTHFDVSGIAGANMRAHCEDPDDIDSYYRSYPPGQQWPGPSTDWMVRCLPPSPEEGREPAETNKARQWLGESWRLSMDLNSGVVNGNGSHARILTQLALDEPKLPRALPSLAETLAIYASSTIINGAVDTPFVHYWDSAEMQLDFPGKLQAFNATIRSQQYTSGHDNDWQGIFYIILTLVFVVSLVCLFYLSLHAGLVTDYTEPQNLFALAMNSPPSAELAGSCGGGPQKRHFNVPWRVAYAPSARHYFFDEALGDDGDGDRGRQ